MLSYPTLHMKRLNILPSNDKQRKLKPCHLTISSMMIFRGNICCKCDLYLIKKHFLRLFTYKLVLYLIKKHFHRLFTYKLDLYLNEKRFIRLFRYKLDLYLIKKRFIRLFTYKIDLYLIRKYFHRLFRYKTNAPNVSMIRSDLNTLITSTTFSAGSNSFYVKDNCHNSPIQTVSSQSNVLRPPYMDIYLTDLNSLLFFLTDLCYKQYDSVPTD